MLFDWSMAEFVSNYLDDERLQIAYLGQGVIGTNASPFDAGTASIRFHHASGRLGGMPGMWGYVKGGMGMVSFYFCDAAREAGATVIAGVPVAQILPGEGVLLEGGEKIAARVVISNADPRRTLALARQASRRRVESPRRARPDRGMHGEAQRASARTAQLHRAPRNRQRAPLRADQCAAHQRGVEGGLCRCARRRVAGASVVRALLPERARPLRDARGHAHHERLRAVCAVQIRAGRLGDAARRGEAARAQIHRPLLQQHRLGGHRCAGSGAARHRAEGGADRAATSSRASACPPTCGPIA